MELGEDVLDELFSRGTAEFIDPDNTFRGKLEAKIRGEYDAPLYIKFGVDPTRPDIHLGHAVVFWKLRKLQDLGCTVIFLVGDYTAQIGDPTGKSKVRPELSQKQIEENMKTFLDQVGKILRTDQDAFTWIRNSDWFTAVADLEPKEGIMVRIMNRGVNPRSFVGKSILYSETRMQKSRLKKDEIVNITLSSFLRTLRKLTHSRLIERDMFQNRINAGEELFMHEMMYPVLQGIDSYALARIYGSCDLEVGGSDQTFNMLMARDIMKINGQKQQSVLSFELLEGLDGKEKMSKSLDNYIAITDAPNDMYGKTMSLPDELISRYFTLATFAGSEQITDIEQALERGELHPKQAKMQLAHQIVALYHGEEAADEAERAFEQTFSKGEIPTGVPVVLVSRETLLCDSIVDAEMVSSRSEFRRLVDSGAITHLERNEKVLPDAKAEPGTYRIGKKRFIKIQEAD